MLGVPGEEGTPVSTMGVASAVAHAAEEQAAAALGHAATAAAKLSVVVLLDMGHDGGGGGGGWEVEGQAARLARTAIGTPAPTMAAA